MRKAIITWFGCGEMRFASGTWGSAGAMVVATAWYFTCRAVVGALLAASVFNAGLVVGIIAACVLSVAWGPWAIAYFEKHHNTRKPGDPGAFVLDEVAGQWLSLLWLPVMTTWQHGFVIAAVQFFWFRATDVIKPPPGRALEKLHGGWGILLDDLSSAVYANVIGQIYIPRMDGLDMTDVLRAAALGVVEGLTEFLPVSSTAHIILTAPLVGADIMAPLWAAFLYFIQIGAILAVIVYFAKPLMAEVFRYPPNGWSNHLLVKLAVAMVPGAIVKLAFGKWIDAHFEAAVPIAIMFIIGALVMELIERRHHHGKTRDISSVTLRQALAIGLAQCVSVIPGTSRSLATIMGGMLVGLSPETLTVFSFYLAIPTILAAGGHGLLKNRAALRPDDALVLGVGFMTAFVVALVVVSPFLNFVRTRRLRPFAMYRVVMGVAILLAWRMHWLGGA